MANCPNCSKTQLTIQEPTANLAAQQCPSCNGYWIKLNDYRKWQKNTEQLTAVTNDIEVEAETVESTHALLCPESGGLMTKFRVSSDTDHRIDWSAHSDGIWLDSGEWELLIEKGVADKLNQIFTEQWQDKILNETSKNTKEQRLIEQLGEENYSRLQLVRTWLHEQPAENKALMVSFLVAPDPFK